MPHDAADFDLAVGLVGLRRRDHAGVGADLHREAGGGKGVSVPAAALRPAEAGAAAVPAAHQQAQQLKS